MKIAVVPASGMGDSLIMLSVLGPLKQIGHTAVIFSDFLADLGPWVDQFDILSQATLLNTDSPLHDFDAVILQYDNSEKAKKIKTLQKPIFCFYGSYLPEKHGPLQPLDFVCDQNRTIVDNLQQALTKWFHSPPKKLSLSPPQNLTYKKYPLRVAIHPTSTDINKNWPFSKYKELSIELKKIGFDPQFITDETKPRFSSLNDLAAFIYESGSFIGNDSGPGHLASLLNIPTLTIAQSKKHLRFWRPGFNLGNIITAPNFVLYFKFFRKFWKSFISTKVVIKKLKKLLINSN